MSEATQETAPVQSVPGPDLGLSEATKAFLPAVPDGWSAYPSLGGGWGAKKWFDGGYKDVVVSEPADLLAACKALDAQAPVPAPQPEDKFQEAVEAPESPAVAPSETEQVPESTEIVVAPVEDAETADAPAAGTPADTAEGADTPATDEAAEATS